MRFLAMDIGSSFIKAAVLDLEEHIISNYRIGHQLKKKPGPALYYEIDAGVLFQEVKNLIDAYLVEYKGDIGGILFSTQMHGFVLADMEGNPRSPYISWQDERCLSKLPDGSKTYLEEMAGFISREDMRESGVYLKPYLAMCNLYTMRQQGYAMQEGTLFCTLGSYLILRLTGSHICHITNACPTGFANAVYGEWNWDLIKRTGCEDLQFPEIRQDLTACGCYCWNGKEIPVYPDLGDHQGCVLGIRAIPENDLIVNIGTAGQLAYIRTAFYHGDFESRPFFDGCYLNTVSRMPGGRNLDVMVRFLTDVVQRFSGRSVTDRDIWRKIVDELGQIESGGLEVNTSFYKTVYGETGSICRIDSTNLTVDHLFSACFEDMAEVYNRYIDCICPDRAKIQRLVFAGGFLGKTPLLQKIISDRVGIQGVPALMKNEIFIGLFRAAMVCAGLCSTVAETIEIPVADAA